MMLRISEQRLAWCLGLAGLVPFITSGVLAWSMPLAWQATAIECFVYYSAIILSFLGGAHWGNALQVRQPSRRWRLLLAMLPSLIAWPALLLNAAVGLWVLLAGFILMGSYDLSRSGRAGFPGWYPPLRGFLSVVVVLLHFVVLVRINV